MESLGERFILSVFLLRHLGLRKCLRCSRESWLCVFLLCLDHSWSNSSGHNYLTYGDVEKSPKQRSFGRFRQERRTSILENRSQEGRRHSLWSEGQRKRKGVIPCRKQNCAFCSYFPCVWFPMRTGSVGAKGSLLVTNKVWNPQVIPPPALGDTELGIPMPGTYGCCLEVLNIFF